MPTIVIVCVSVSPATMPSGRRRPPVPLADSSAGRTGSTHGVIAVAAPATNAKASRRIIVVFSSRFRGEEWRYGCMS